MKKILGVIGVLGLATYAIATSLRKEEDVRLEEAKTRLEKLKRLKELDLNDAIDKNFDVDAAIAELERYINGYKCDCENDLCKQNTNTVNEDYERFIIDDADASDAGDASDAEKEVNKNEEIKNILQEMFPYAKIRIPTKDELNTFLSAKDDADKRRMDNLKKNKR